MNRLRTGSAAESAHASDRARRRRIAAARTARASRVLVCEPEGAASAGMREAIASLGYETGHCPTLADALRDTARFTPDVLVVVLPDGSSETVSLLQLLRRAAPAVPLVLVAPGATLDTRARCHALRPYYFAVPPVTNDELRAVVQGAATSAAHRA